MMEGLAFQADKALLDTVFDGVAVIDLKTFRISLANNAAANILGFDSPDEMVGAEPLKHVSQDDRERVSTLLASIVSGNYLRQGTEVRVLDKRGKEIWIMARGVKLASNGTSVLLASFRDITAQKLADMALREAECKQLELLNISNEMILISRDWKVVFVNRRLQEATGLSGEALTGMSILDLTHPDDRRAVAQRYQKMLDGEYIPSDRAFKGIGKDGKTAWGMMRHVPLTWQGKPALMTIVQDITQQKLAEEALQESERRYRLVTENASDVIWTTDVDLNITYMTPSAAGLLRCSMEEAMTLTLRDMLTPESLDLGMKAFKEQLDLETRGVASPQREWSLDLQLRRRDGSTVWVEEKVNFLRDAGGRITGLMGITRDISGRKQAEESLRASEEKYRALAEKTTDIIWTTDLSLRSTYVSPSVEKVLGFTPEERLKQPVEAQMTPASYANVQALLQEELRREQEGQYDPERTIRIETEYYHKNGSTVWMENLVSAIRDKEGHIVGVHGVSRDVTDRRQAEESAKLAAQEWEETFSSITDMISIQDKDSHIIRANKAFADCLGMKSNDINGRKCYEIVHGMKLPWPDCPHQKCITSGRPCTEELWEPRLGKYLQVSVSPLFNSRDEVAGTVHIARDISERKKAEEALQESEEKFKALVENAAAVVFSLDTQGNIVYISPAIERLSGFRADEVIGTSCLQYVMPEDLPGLMASMEKTLAGQLEPYEFRVKHKNGAVHHILTSSRPVARNGELAGLIGVMVDVTERKVAEEALRHSERRYRLLAENVKDVIFTTDLRLNINYVSPSVVKLLGFSPEEILQTSLDRLVTPASLEAGMRVAGEHLARESESGSNGFWTVEMELMRKDGGTVWVEVTTNFVRGQDSQAIGLTGVVRDISERKAAQDALKDSEAKYRNLFEHTLVGMEVMDAETGKVVLANHSLARMCGFKSPEDMVGTAPLDYVLPEDLEWVTAELAKAMANPNMYEVATLRARTEDGRIIWVDGMTTQFDYEGRPSLLVSLVNVTAAKEAQLKVAESEEKSRLLIDNAAEGIAVVQDGRLEFVNRKCSEIIGLPPEDLVSMSFLDLIHPDDRQMMAENYARRLSGEEVLNNYQFRIVDKSGNTKWLQINTVQFGWEGKPAVLSMLTDVTERKQAEEALQESEERFRALIEGARDAIAVIDLNGKVTYSSPSAERMTNGSVENLMTMSLQERLHPDDVGNATSIFESLMKSPDGTVVDVELRYRRDDGSWGVIEARGTNRIHDPKISGIVVNYRDITQRRRAEEALRESESRYRLLAENVSDVIWSVNMRSKRSFFSPSVTRLLGYTVEEAQSMKMKEVVSPTSYPKAMMAFSKMSTKQGNGSDSRSSSTQLELELMRKDGSFVWVDISVTLLRDVNGQPAEIFGVIRDITQRKKVEEDLRTSEEYFRALIENAWDAIAIVNAEGTMLYESPSSARILGYEPEEIVGKNLAEFVRPEDVAANVEMFRKFRTEPGSIVMVDAGFRHKDGHYIECEGTLQNFLHDPKINGVVANYRDMTDRRRAEEAIRTSEERFRNLVEATSDWVWEVDPNGVYTYVSPKVHEVMGYEVSEIVGRSIFDFMPSRESSRFARTFKSHAEKREPFAFLETSRQRKDGKVIVMETSGVPFFGGDGRLLGYRGIGRDITNRKNIERELERSVKKLEKTMEAAIQAISYTMETRDPYTTGHQRRVTQLACAIAKEMGVAAWQIDGIRVAGLLHDIGKIAVPTEILSKPGRLSDIEFSMIKAHPKVGFDILKNVEFEWPIARIVVQHHERLDGSGYPYGIPGRDILQEARILAVADVVEAMSSHRPYRPALGIDKALAEVARGEGTLYDSVVVRACSRVINERGFKFES